MRSQGSQKEPEKFGKRTSMGAGDAMKKLAHGLMTCNGKKQHQGEREGSMNAVG